MHTPAIATLLILSSGLVAADTPVQFINRRSNVLGLTNVADPALVAAAALFSTADGGQSWQLVAEVAAPADGRSFPKFTFTAPADGVYGLYSRTVFRTGHREADPRPGVAPLYVLAIDSTPPVFTTAEVRLVGTAANLARFHATWALDEANPSDPPVAIEVRSADGRFLPVATGSAKGSLELSVPATAGTATLLVRFTATDRAGNTVRSEPVALPLTAPPLDGAARTALAQAVKDMPTLADLGIGRQAPATAPAPRPPARPTVRPAPAPVSAPAAPPPAPLPVAVAEPAVPPPPAIPAASDEAIPPPPAIPVAAGPPPSRPEPVEPPVEDGQRPPPPKLAYVSGDKADDLLRDARVAVRFNRHDEALDFYDRVLSSSRIEDGIHDLVHLLTRLRRPKDLCTVVDALPPEYHDDQVRLEHGRALVTLGRHASAEQVLSGIGSRSLEAREARLLIARCWRATGRDADATRVLTALAVGDDGIAQAARAALAGR